MSLFSNWIRNVAPSSGDRKTTINYWKSTPVKRKAGLGGGLLKGAASSGEAFEHTKGKSLIHPTGGKQSELRGWIKREEPDNCASIILPVKNNTQAHLKKDGDVGIEERDGDDEKVKRANSTFGGGEERTGPLVRGTKGRGKPFKTYFGGNRRRRRMRTEEPRSGSGKFRLNRPERRTRQPKGRSWDAIIRDKVTGTLARGLTNRCLLSYRFGSAGNHHQ